MSVRNPEAIRAELVARLREHAVEVWEVRNTILVPVRAVLIALGGFALCLVSLEHFQVYGNMVFWEDSQVTGVCGDGGYRQVRDLDDTIRGLRRRKWVTRIPFPEGVTSFRLRVVRRLL